jgi:fructan beta-fructosidase
VEIFAQGGQVTMTELIFPDSDSVDITAYACGGTATLTSLVVMTELS